MLLHCLTLNDLVQLVHLPAASVPAVPVPAASVPASVPRSIAALVLFPVDPAETCRVSLQDGLE